MTGLPINVFFVLSNCRKSLDQAFMQNNGSVNKTINPCRLDESLVPRVNSRILLLNETLQKYNLPTIPDFYLKENKTHS